MGYSGKVENSLQETTCSSTTTRWKNNLSKADCRQHEQYSAMETSHQKRVSYQPPTFTQRNLKNMGLTIDLLLIWSKKAGGRKQETWLRTPLPTHNLHLLLTWLASKPKSSSTLGFLLASSTSSACKIANRLNWSNCLKGWEAKSPIKSKAGSKRGKHYSMRIMRWT